ncbi:MAG: glycosyltransferase 87 family protein, partial [Candidatus Thorarchaeota archaeon]
IIESGWNGHFEPLVILLTLLSFWFLFEGRSRLSALSLALAVAAKVYPIVLFPIFVVYLKDWRERLEYTVIAAVTGIATFLPFFIPLWLRPSSGTIDESPLPTGSLFESLFGQFESLGIIELSSLLVFLCVGISIAIMIGLILKNNPNQNVGVYFGGTRAIGIVLIILGSIAAVFVAHPIATMTHWRYPLDIGLVRGVIAILLGSYLLMITLRKWHSDANEIATIEPLMTLACGALLLLMAISRTVFFGWYLLWSLPFFLIIKDRRLGFTVILCFLFLFPGYTSGDFASLGIEEEKIWSEDFTGVEDWNVTIYGTNESLSTGDITAGIENDNQFARLWFNTTSADQQALADIRIGISKEVTIDFDSSMDFVLKIAAGWDPTFGRCADLAFSFNGSFSNGDNMHGYFIPPSSMFTNLTYIQWRSALESQYDTETISIRSLTFWILPVKSISSQYMIESMFTTSSGIIHPYFLILVPSLFSMNIIILIFLYRELGKKS